MERIFLSENDLDEMGILSRASRFRGRQTGDFPKPIKLSRGRIGYPKQAIDAWVTERMEGDLHAA